MQVIGKHSANWPLEFSVLKHFLFGPLGNRIRTKNFYPTNQNIKSQSTLCECKQSNSPVLFSVIPCETETFSVDWKSLSLISGLDWKEWPQPLPKEVSTEAGSCPPLLPLFIPSFWSLLILVHWKNLVATIPEPEPCLDTAMSIGRNMYGMP